MNRSHHTPLEFHSENSIAILTFPDKDVQPRLSRTMLAVLAERFDGFRNKNLLRGVIVQANSKSFATGADIEELVTLDAVAGRDFAMRGQAIFNRIAAFHLPVVAAIRGYCLGGGLDLALACHARVSTFDSTFGQPGGVLGLMTGWGGTQRLPRLVGKAQALQMLLTGERVPATQALTLGLVDELVNSQDLTSAAIQWCERMAGFPRTGTT